MLTVKSARLPQWNNAEHTSLNLQVTFEETAATLGEIPFTASPEDREGHGRELFARATTLEFGAVAAPSPALLAQAAMLTRSRLNAQATTTIAVQQVTLDTLRDAIRLGLATEAEAAALPIKQAEIDAWCVYRVYLSRIETQADFPARIEWPMAPAVSFSAVVDPVPD